MLMLFIFSEHIYKNRNLIYCTNVAANITDHHKRLITDSSWPRLIDCELVDAHINWIYRIKNQTVDLRPYCIFFQGQHKLYKGSIDWWEKIRNSDLGNAAKMWWAKSKCLDWKNTSVFCTQAHINTQASTRNLCPILSVSICPISRRRRRRKR